MRATATSSNNVLFFGRANLFIMFTFFFHSSAAAAVFISSILSSFLCLSLFFRSVPRCKMQDKYHFKILKSPTTIHASIHQSHCLMIDFLCWYNFCVCFSRKKQERKINLNAFQQKFRIVNINGITKNKKKNCVAKRVSPYTKQKAKQKKHTQFNDNGSTTFHIYTMPFLSVWDANLYIICNCTHRIWNWRHRLYSFYYIIHHHHHSYIVDVQQSNRHTHTHKY